RNQHLRLRTLFGMGQNLPDVLLVVPRRKLALRLPIEGLGQKNMKSDARWVRLQRTLPACDSFIVVSKMAGEHAEVGQSIAIPGEKRNHLFVLRVGFVILP